MTKQLPPLALRKDDILEVENYLLERLPQKLGVDKALIQDGYTLEIRDRVGAHEFKTIRDYSPSTFGLDTVTVRQNIFYLGRPKIFHLKLSFDRRRIFSETDISFQDEESRRVVLDIWTDIEGIVQSRRTIAWLFHPPSIVEAIMMGVLTTLSFYVFVFIIVSFIKGHATFWPVIFPFCIASYWVLARLQPWTVFDSLGSRRASRVLVWLIPGILLILLGDIVNRFVISPLFGRSK